MDTHPDTIQAISTALGAVAGSLTGNRNTGSLTGNRNTGSLHLADGNEVESNSGEYSVI